MYNVEKHSQLIEDRLFELADATTVDGIIWRAIYTKEDIIGKNLIRKWMVQSGLEVYEDAIGNLFGRVKGELEDTILIGSHIDTVKDGGKYDGAAGIVSAISSVSELIKNYGQPKKTIEVVALAEEEASRFPAGYFGSKTITGKMTEPDLNDIDETGLALFEAMRKAGYDPEKVPNSKRNNIEAYIEMHIEQGPFLEQKGIKIGIVENIVGIINHKIMIKGRQNHAGTTPMNMRLDPMVAAAKAIVEITELARNISNTATLTVGKIDSTPGMTNVIANEVYYTIDLRDGNKETLNEINNKIKTVLKDLEQKDFTVIIQELCNEMPVELDKKLINTLDTITKQNKISSIHMNSGAGHDAQIFATEVPTCLFFIPSKDGISHCKEEYTSVEDLGVGFEVLSCIIKENAW